MRKYLLLFIVIIALVGCSEKIDSNVKESNSNDEIDVGINDSMQVVMDKQEDIGNTTYDYTESYSEKDEIERVYIDFEEVKGIELFGEEIGEIYYTFEKENEEYLLKNAIYVFKNIKLDSDSDDNIKHYNNIMDQLTEIYGKPTKHYSNSHIVPHLQTDESEDEFLSGFESEDAFIIPLNEFSLQIQELDSYRMEEKQAESDVSDYKDNAQNNLEDANDFTLEQINPNVNIDEITLSDYEDSLVILTFFTTGIPPVEANIKLLNEFYNRYDDIKVFAINISEREYNENDVQDFIIEHNLSIPILDDKNTNISQLYSVDVIPTAFIINKDMKILQTLFGDIDNSELEEIISKSK